MSALRKFLGFVLLVLLATTPVLTACQPAATPTTAPGSPTTAPVSPTQPPAAAATPLPTAGSFQPTEAPSAAPTEASTVVPVGAMGGKFVYATAEQPDTLDIQKSGFGITWNVSTWIGGSLVTKDVNGNYIPYLAESWTISPDGLTWTLKLRQDVKFHNGDPLRAQDWVYTINRAKDPATKSPVTKGMVDPIKTATAEDDYTLVLTLEKPFYPMLENLTSEYLEPYDQKAVEAEGDNYGRNPVGVGPYKFKEWKADEYILLERNPDYQWGPKYFEGANPGPAYFDQMEYRVLPEYATQLAGFQSGDLDMIYPQPKDADAIKAQTDKTLTVTPSTATFHLIVNEKKAPFSDMNVRKAFAMAIDRQAIIKVVTNGMAVEIHGPLSPAVTGYDPNVEKVGFGFDLEQAKQLMQQAGYTYGADGMLTKDGQPFKVTLKTPTIDYYVKISQILQQQWKTLGVTTDIQQFEWGTLSPQYISGDFEIGTLEVGWPEADILYNWFHSSQVGTFWGPQVGFPELDALLEKTRTSTDPTERQNYVNQAQEYIAKNLLLIPILSMPSLVAINNRIQGAKVSPFLSPAATIMSAYLAK